MDTVTIDAYAKINLFLEVKDKRTDGYHNIESIMHSISLCDTITVAKAKQDIIISNDAGLPNDEHNLCYKAAKAFFAFTGIADGCKIQIQKRIPVSAGMAGGSTDGAAVLKALNTIYQTGLSVSTLCEIGAKIGADVPFCIKKTPCLCEGTGEILSDCPHLPHCFIVTAKKGAGVSTPIAYKSIDDLRKTDYSYKKSDKILTALEKQDLFAISENMYNAFEKVIEKERPEVSVIKKIMYENGAVCSMMSGSGPSVFGLFDKEINAISALEKLRQISASADISTPVYN